MPSIGLGDDVYSSVYLYSQWNWVLYTPVFTFTVNETGGDVYSNVYLYSHWECCLQQRLPVQSVGMGVLYTAVFTCTVNETGGVVYSSVYLYS